MTEGRRLRGVEHFGGFVKEGLLDTLKGGWGSDGETDPVGETCGLGDGTPRSVYGLFLFCFVPFVFVCFLKGAGGRFVFSRPNTLLPSVRSPPTPRG